MSVKFDRVMVITRRYEMKVLNNSVFPIHKGTFQGVATDESMADKPYKLIHADADTVLEVTFEDASAITMSLGKGEDVSCADAVIITSNASVKLS